MNPKSIIVIAIVGLLGGLAFDYFTPSSCAPTNVITTNRVAMQSPPSALEAPVMDGMLIVTNAATNLCELRNNGVEVFRVSADKQLFVHGKLVGQITTNDFVPVSPPATNTPILAPTFADGVLIAVAVLRSNPGFATLLTQQEQVALCARVWQQQRGNTK